MNNYFPQPCLNTYYIIHIHINYNLNVNINMQLYAHICDYFNFNLILFY